MKLLMVKRIDKHRLVVRVECGEHWREYSIVSGAWVLGGVFGIEWGEDIATILDICQRALEDRQLLDHLKETALASEISGTICLAQEEPGEIETIVDSTVNYKIPSSERQGQEEKETITSGGNPFDDWPVLMMLPKSTPDLDDEEKESLAREMVGASKILMSEEEENEREEEATKLTPEEQAYYDRIDRKTDELEEERLER